MDEYKWYLYLFLSKIRSLQSESCNRTGIEWLRLEKIINNGNWTQTIIKLSQGAGSSRLSPRNRLKIIMNCEKPALFELIDTSESYSGVYFRKVFFNIIILLYFQRKMRSYEINYGSVDICNFSWAFSEPRFDNCTSLKPIYWRFQSKFSSEANVYWNPKLEFKRS